VNTHSMMGSRRQVVTEPGSLREVWVFLLGMGVALMLLGVAAISSSLIATFATMLVFGILLLLGAIFQVVTAFWGRSWRGFFVHLLTGVLYLIAGIFLINNPIGAALGLTLLLAVCLLAGGVVRVLLSVFERFEGWGWVFVNGFISVLLGAAIWLQWPLSGLWTIGLFLGIDMLLNGWSWVMFALAMRSVGKRSMAT